MPLQFTRVDRTGPGELTCRAKRGPIRTRMFEFGDVVGLTWSAIHRIHQRSLSLTLNCEHPLQCEIAAQSQHRVLYPLPTGRCQPHGLGGHTRTLIRLTQVLPGQTRELPPRKMMASSSDILRSQVVEATTIRRARWECAHIYARGGC